MTDRQRLTWQQTFFRRVISLSTARWFFSLLNEQWWRDRSADGVVTDLRVMQERGPGVAGGLLGGNFSSLWVVEVVEGCWARNLWEGRCSAKRPDSSVGSGILLLWRPHGGRGSAQSSGRRRKDRRNTRKGTRWRTESQRTENTQAHDMDDHVDEMTRTNTFFSHAVWCAAIGACSLHEKKWRMSCTVYIKWPVERNYVGSGPVSHRRTCAFNKKSWLLQCLQKL